MISSLLDNELSVFAVQQGILGFFPGLQAEYTFHDREGSRRYPRHFVEALEESIKGLAGLRLQPEELSWLKTVAFFPAEYLKYLQNYRFNPELVTVGSEGDERLHLKVKGPWEEAVLWQAPLQSLVNEVYFREVDNDWDVDLDSYYAMTLDKASNLISLGLTLVERGTRYRRSFDLHEVVVRALRSASGISTDGGKGMLFTTNLHLSRLYGVSALAGIPHEWVSAHECRFGLKRAYPQSLENWRTIHQGQHAVASADTFTANLFFSQLSSTMARAFRGLRSDSGEPRDFFEQVIAFYFEHGIDPAEHFLLLTEGLDVEAVGPLVDHIGGRMPLYLGLGAEWVNDFPQGSNKGMSFYLEKLDDQPVVRTSSIPEKAFGSRHSVQSLFHQIVQLQYEIEREAGYRPSDLPPQP